MAKYSVIIPAHNEASVISRCLSALFSDLASSEIEVLVVANGCSDDTVAIASKFEGVKVIDLETPSKVAALNEGDLHVGGDYIAYVDADVELTGRDLLCTIRALEENPSLMVVSPKPRFDLSGSNVWVRAFYAIWEKLPYFADLRMVGSGVFVLSRTARSMFGDFPQIISDDGYVRSLFKPHQRETIIKTSFTVFAPKNLSSLIKIKSRVRLGNMEIQKKFPFMAIGGENNSKAILKVVLRRPWLLPAAVVYVYTQYRTKAIAQTRFQKMDFSSWDRDESSRLN